MLVAGHEPNIELLVRQLVGLGQQPLPFFKKEWNIKNNSCLISIYNCFIFALTAYATCWAEDAAFAIALFVYN